MKSITDERAELAFQYLVDTDEICAAAKANMERFEWRLKSTKASVLLHEQGTVAERQAKAETHEQTGIAAEGYFAAIREYSAIANKRETERIAMDTWRTIQANRRHG
jgi:hypothetical protein